jgi:hypothetical protein
LAPSFVVGSSQKKLDPSKFKVKQPNLDISDPKCSAVMDSACRIVVHRTISKMITTIIANQHLNPSHCGQRSCWSGLVGAAQPCKGKCSL